MIDSEIEVDDRKSTTHRDIDPDREESEDRERFEEELSRRSEEPADELSTGPDDALGGFALFFVRSDYPDARRDALLDRLERLGWVLFVVAVAAVVLRWLRKRAQFKSRFRLQQT